MAAKATFRNEYVIIRHALQGSEFYTSDTLQVEFCRLAEKLRKWQLYTQVSSHKACNRPDENGDNLRTFVSSSLGLLDC